ADRALNIELGIFEQLAKTVTQASEPIKAAAEALAVLDVTTALAALAGERDYARPDVEDSKAFVIEGGRHPVVEQARSGDGGPFIANSCDLSPPAGEQNGRIWLL